VAELRINHTTILTLLGEPAQQEVDAIIHPTNNYLWFSPGLSEKLKQAGGEALEEEATRLGPIEVGSAAVSTPGRLPCKHLIHAAAWGQDLMTNKYKVRKATLAALQLASERGCLSAAIVPVGAGVGRFPLAQAIEATFLALVEHSLKPAALKEVRFLADNPAEARILDNIIDSANHANPDTNRFFL